MYVNGAVSAVQNSPSTQAISNLVRANTWLGKSNYDGDGYIQGVFDEPEISNVVRSADWAKLSYQTQITSSTILAFGSQVDAPPSNLTYSPNPAVYTVSFAIPANNPTLNSVATHYAVSPALPPGFSLRSIWLGVIATELCTPH